MFSSYSVRSLKSCCFKYMLKYIKAYRRNMADEKMEKSILKLDFDKSMLVDCT